MSKQAEQQTSAEQFPIGGSRQAVHDALRTRGFVMGHFGDKTWKRRDGLEVHIYGTGSMLMVRGPGDLLVHDAKMADSLAFIDKLDADLSRGTTP